MDVVESVPFGFVPHAFELRFNHLVDPDNGKTFLHLIYKFGIDETHFKEFEVLLPVFEVERVDIESTLQA
jgi:hypothetical protein